MARSSQSDTESRRLAGLSGAKFTFRQESNQGTFRRKLVAYLSRFARHEWSVAILYLFLDIASWIAIYGIVGWLRYDAFYATPFQFFIIDLIQLAVIVQALYFIGGYDRAVEKRTLAYATEHLLAIARRDYMLDRKKWKEWSTGLQDPSLQSWSRLQLSRCLVVSCGISRAFTRLTNSYHASRRQSTQPR